MKKKVSKDTKERVQFSPKSEKQRLILTDMDTDILLCGGENALPPR